MIGPHEGKELELMLAGKKHLAAFGDIIPEKKFPPYVENGLELFILTNSIFIIPTSTMIQTSIN
jgi:hypothetical protein